MIGRLFRIVFVLCALAFGAFLFAFRPFTGPGGAIPQGWGHGFVPAFVGRPAVSRPVGGERVPPHPFMAARDGNQMHVDAYASDAHTSPGPLGVDPEVRSIARGRVGGECATVTFDRAGRIVAVCATFAGPRLMVLDPRTLAEIAGLDLPQRPSMRSLSLRAIVTDTSGGAYFYLDHLDRAVLVTSDHRLRVVAEIETDARLELRVVQAYDLAPALREAGHAEDTVTTALPDWEGRYWFVTRQGLVGTVDPASGDVATVALRGEEVQNSFAVAADGVYIVSDHALYRMVAEREGGRPGIVWREPYDRGTSRKVGMIHQGSGTTPTLLGDEWVAIADNAEPRVNLLVYRRRGNDGDRFVCRVPVFAPGRSAAENSPIGFGRTLIVENNHGYDLFPTMMLGRTATGGVARIDIAPDGRSCGQTWESPEISQTVVAKLSLANGLVYLYTKEPNAPWWTDAYYLTALDLETGATVFRILTGTGVGYDNHWAPITLGPDGTVYVGTLRGLVAVRDRPGGELRAGAGMPVRR